VPVLSVTSPSSAHTATSFNLTVTAQDSFGAPVTGYTDAIHFTSSDPLATLPPDGALTGGTGVFPVTLFSPGNQTITATDITYPTITRTSSPVNVLARAPAISKTFGASSIPLHGMTTLSFTITNPNRRFALSEIAFVDKMPSGLVVATPNGLTGQCGAGKITAISRSSRVSLTGASIPAGGSCSFSVSVTGTTAGTKNNVTSVSTSAESGKGPPASATLTVTAP